jgi:ribosomal protein L21
MVQANNMAMDVEVGQTITLDHILLVGARDYTLVGLPQVEGAYVKAVVEEHNKTAKYVHASSCVITPSVHILTLVWNECR